MKALVNFFSTHDPELKQLREEKREKMKRIERFLELDFVTEGANGERVVDVSALSEQWSEFMPGMDLRLADIEGFNKGTVVKCRVRAGTLMERHWHREAESLFMLSGTMKDEETGRIVKAGESMQFAARQWHQPHYLEDSYVLLLWVPPLIKVPNAETKS